ncbi:uncharacterized protein B0P05DRAFT_41334 [Gilbertella persicaria]|uniref:uncharacterized protein n=1 Tax=Gilbertella persicaria TaxID=101096 RepID=UPI00222004C2|nr:uncharacterized protein B0P05DRAFT_41334 [Gilbertella persicaria]KAI8084019.1 hypothetical protein B0P05DRAFT_41334 [Gilbertella persicaria]
MSESQVHLLPFSVDKEGSINTKTYLHIEKQQDHYETVIHGRRLIGHQVYLNTPTQGQVWTKQEEDEEEDEEENKVWHKSNITIQDFILWKKDTAPDTQDPRINALKQWIPISQAVRYNRSEFM